jgi:hypothetical protein
MQEVWVHKMHAISYSICTQTSYKVEDTVCTILH